MPGSHTAGGRRARIAATSLAVTGENKTVEEVQSRSGRTRRAVTFSSGEADAKRAMAASHGFVDRAMELLLSGKPLPALPAGASGPDGMGGGVLPLVSPSSMRAAVGEDGAISRAALEAVGPAATGRGIDAACTAQGSPQRARRPGGARGRIQRGRGCCRWLTFK